MSTDTNDWNRKVIEEFRANGGAVGGNFAQMPLLLLHHTGAKTGTTRVNPVAYQKVGDAYAIFASKGGSPTNPDWYHNVRAHPDVQVEVGTETFPARARIAEGDERSRIWEAQKAVMPQFAQYEKNAPNREIPVVVLEKTST